MLAAAQRVFEEVNSSGRSLPVSSDHTSYLDEEAESMRWFLLPSEAQRALAGMATPTATPPFHPRLYPSTAASNPSKNGTSPSDTNLCQDSCKLGKESVVVESVREKKKELEGRSGEKKREDKMADTIKFHCPPKGIYKPTTEVNT